VIWPPLLREKQSASPLLCRWLYLLFLKFQSHHIFLPLPQVFEIDISEFVKRACFWFRDGVEVRLTFLNEGRERFFASAERTRTENSSFSSFTARVE